jgi:SPP1 family phage portal protein
MLMTDEREITKDNIISVVSKAFMEHQENVAQEVFLFEYEKGNQPILNREKKIRPDLNATVVENNASKIVDVHLGYCFSNPITFVQRAKIEPTKKQKKALFGFLRKKDEDDGENIDDLKIAMLNKMMQEQSKAAKDIALGRNLFICGVGYQMMLPNRNKSRYSPFELLVPSPLTTFVVYSNDAYREPVLGCTYSVHDDGTITLTAYSKNFCYTIEHELNTTDYHLKENIAPNPLRRIPVVEFYLNDRMGIFEKVIPLMDAMNLVDSDRINDILQHVQSLLWMHNCQVNEEGKKNLVDGDGVIMTKSTGDGKEAKITYLNQTLNESEVQKLVDHLNSQLEQITSTPSWQEASGGSTTGAMQLSNGWQCLEISAKTVEQLFTDPEMQLIDLAIEIIKTDQRPYDGLKDIEIADVEIRFCRTKTYDLVSKTNSLVALLNAGVDGLTSFNTVGLFTDPQQAWVDSKPIIDGIQKKLASKEEKTQQPNPNAYKDEEGNGGENNTEKDKTEESKQPSKTAMVEE